ncbi:hypothetical protein HXX76_013223 [Chlamydomonas incerta]|uniref:Apple domain-containing protein n=1 Tax=Chlamydomonas incerta TaxID=51695 RepID=A0A835SJD6_CHLIN|nr:hypothetical protein HXX76_013223 [Chlamydomonas incerta]|eukprot:KAG2426032.1 hypothetical protein HXX76_013223 [Chlamydomonas incerta]
MARQLSLRWALVALCAVFLAGSVQGARVRALRADAAAEHLASELSSRRTLDGGEILPNPVQTAELSDPLRRGNRVAGETAVGATTGDGTPAAVPTPSFGHDLAPSPPSPAVYGVYGSPDPEPSPGRSPRPARSPRPKANPSVSAPPLPAYGGEDDASPPPPVYAATKPPSPRPKAAPGTRAPPLPPPYRLDCVGEGYKVNARAVTDDAPFIDFPVNTKNTHAQNLVKCEAACVAKRKCKSFYYRGDGHCYLLRAWGRFVYGGWDTLKSCRIVYPDEEALLSARSADDSSN